VQFLAVTLQEKAQLGGEALPTPTLSSQIAKLGVKPWRNSIQSLFRCGSQPVEGFLCQVKKLLPGKFACRTVEPSLNKFGIPCLHDESKTLSHLDPFVQVLDEIVGSDLEL